MTDSDITTVYGCQHLTLLYRRWERPKALSDIKPPLMTLNESSGSHFFFLALTGRSSTKDNRVQIFSTGGICRNFMVNTVETAATLNGI